MEKRTCKYCGKELNKVLMPPESDWGVEFFLVCMSDECSYYLNGWDWMQSHYQVKASYRYKYDPTTDSDGPIPIKNPNDMKDWIVVEFNKI